jgi:CubicO group peptidase (beta-lactamase class C family)
VLDRASYLSRAWSTPLGFPPGSRYSYSNVGFTVLAAVIEEVTGLSYEDFLRREILLPRGLRHTGYAAVVGPEFGENFRQAAEISWGGQVTSWHLMGNGGMLSTPRDLLAWVLAAETDGGETGRVRDLTHQPYQREGENATSHYGYGLVVEDAPGWGPLFWHNGGSRVANGHWRYYPRQQVAIVVTSDQWEVSADAMAGSLAKTLTP